LQAIAYIRICRPGSVIGPQQTFLHINEAELWKHGELYRQQQKVSRSVCHCAQPVRW
jgi:cell division cycle 14